MKLKSIKLEDFRGIPSLHIPFDENLTVIVGDNGIGKTSVLDALCFSLLALRTYWPLDKVQQYHIPEIKASDIAVTKPDCMIQVEASLSSEISDEKLLQLSLGGDRNNNVKALRNILPNSESQIRRRSSYPQPLFLYYRQNRGFAMGRNRTSVELRSEENIRAQSLEIDLRAIQDLSAWWDKLDAQEARYCRDVNENFRDPQLQAIRSLIEEMEEFSSISYDATSNWPGLYLEKTDGPKIHIDFLSSGERVYLILLADLARRLQIIQPKAGLSEICAIVLIDEVELNLHPHWQRRILCTLTEIFRKCQFIVTTHSPQVLGEIKHGKIIRMRKDDQAHISCDSIVGTYGRDSNEILLNVLGSPERDHYVKAQLEKIDGLINRNDLNEARSLVDKLRSEMGGRPVDLEIAERRLVRRERSSCK